MSAEDTVREQFSALQRQQKERLNQLKEKSNKKKLSTVDVSLNDWIYFLSFYFTSLGQCFNES